LFEDSGLGPKSLEFPLPVNVITVSREQAGSLGTGPWHQTSPYMARTDEAQRHWIHGPGKDSYWVHAARCMCGAPHGCMQPPPLEMASLALSLIRFFILRLLFIHHQRQRTQWQLHGLHVLQHRDPFSTH
jgi:hypothetical protein